MNSVKCFVLLIIIILAFLATGCSTTVPVVAKFPKAPERLMQPCPQLEKLENEAKLSDVAKSVVNNYTKYHECSIQNESWIEWYKTQKQIFESVK
jgi:PBP1b-binding outer membrane lipoprotein LpoB